MAVVSEINALVGLVDKSINLVQGIGRGWYKNSQAIGDFVQLVRVLRYKAENWERLLRNSAPEAQNLVRPTLNAALETLDREDASMRSRQASCMLRWSYRSLNIGEASMAIQSVCQAFDQISRALEDAWRADRILTRMTTSAYASLPFGSDRKYVPLLQPLQAVQRALESTVGPRVVTLYGQPGSGKTVMAKYLAIHYDKPRRQDEERAGERVGQFFSDGVFFLTCGPGATSKALHEELWQNFGFRTTFDLDNQNETVSIGSGDVHSETMLHKQLIGRLVDSSLLIILDDVWDTRVLERLLLPGRGLKYLVTSQEKRIWDDAVQINIAQPSLEDARKILANHVFGLPAGKEFPHDIQDVADDVIQKSEFNPLVLANLALTVSCERATSLDEWITVRKYLFELLDDDGKGPVAFEETYPRTVASTMTMAVNSMSVETKNLLFLAAVCDGPSVPEIVLKVFFKALVGSIARFQKWCNYLEDRVFIQIQTQVVEWTIVPQKSWSLHLLRQHFVREKKKHEVCSMVSDLFGAKHNELDIVSALFVLFAARSYTLENAAGIADLLGISRETTEKSFPWTSVKPFVWLLHVDSDEEWQQNASEMAKKIIVNYVRCGDLDDVGLSTLLQMPQAQFATCWALQSMALSEQRALLTDKHEASLKSLLALLNEDEEPTTQSLGAVALGALALKNQEIILAQPLALQNLLRLVVGDDHAVYHVENLQLYAAWTLGALAASSSAKAAIASHPGMLEALLKLLDRDESSDKSPDIQVEAAYALRRLAYGEKVTTESQSRQMKMITLPGMLAKLVTLLQRGTDATAQKEVVWLLGNLAVSREEKIRIQDYPGVLEGLVDMLDIEDAEFDKQRYHAAYALRRLTIREPNPNLGRVSGAIESLVNLLFAFKNLDVQKEAVHCLSYLAYPEENSIDFAAIPGALEGLVGLLVDCVWPSTQLIATGTLANLIEDGQNKLRIAAEPGAIEGLVRMLTKTGAPPDVQFELRELAAQCLLHLSFRNHENQLKIASLPRALEGLVALLSRSNSRLQLLAVWTLSNLAEAEENRARISAVPAAVRELRGLLEAEDQDAEVQGYAENALSLVLNHAVAPRGTSSVSNGGGSFPKRETATGNEALEDLEKDHNLSVPRDHFQPKTVST